jgi:hypothetical protein
MRTGPKHAESGAYYERVAEKLKGKPRAEAYKTAAAEYTVARRATIGVLARKKLQHNIDRCNLEAEAAQ